MSRRSKLKPHLRAITELVTAMGGTVGDVVFSKHWHVHFVLDSRPGMLVVAESPRCAHDQVNYARQQLQRHRRTA